MNSARDKNVSTAEPNEPLNIWTLNARTIIPRSFTHCRAKRAAKYMNSARDKNVSTAEPNEPLNIWTLNARVQLFLVLSPTAEPNEPAHSVNV